MRDSTRTVDLGERIAHALAERRPQPSSDFEARLERVSDPARHSQVTALLAVAAVACAIVAVVVTRPASVSHPAPAERLERSEWGHGQPPPSATLAPTLPHDGTFTANECNLCHRPAPRAPASHEPNGSFPLVGGHRTVSCATCHAPNKPPQRECRSCHTPGSWKLKK